MAGGLIQLLAWGSQNIKLNGNPSITFFKKVWKSHTNFSMESINLTMDKSDANVYENTIFKTKIKRQGDLMQQIYFVFELPDILANDFEFKWVENLGEAIIDNCTITVGGILIDRQYGEYMHLSNMLSFGVDKRDVYNKMIGNIPHLTNPQLEYGMYPWVSPVIRSTRIYVPMNFWFNKDVASALPLLSMQYSDIELTIELRPIYNLYKLLINGRYMAPDKNNPEHGLRNFVSNEQRRFMVSDAVLDIRASLEVNYYFVDNKEREQIAFNSHEYLIEQLYRIERFNLNATNIYELVLQNPVKEMIWVLKRNDQINDNNWFNFTDGGIPIMQSAKLMFNGMDRMDEKDAAFYNYVQAYQHHRGNPKDGVYVYSFSLFPDDMSQPSGACNMSRINKIQMLIRAIRPFTEDYGYNLTIYIVNYNFLKIQSGLAGVVFSS